MRTPRAAVLATLANDTTINAALARDPQASNAPAVLYGSLNALQPAYPAITFRLPETRPESRLRPTEAEGGGAAPIQNGALELECWHNERTRTAPIEAIADRVCALLDGQVLALTGGGRVFDIALQVRTAPTWDNQLQAWFILLRFSLRVHTA